MVAAIQLAGVNQAARDAVLRTVRARAMPNAAVAVEFGGARGADENAKIAAVQASRQRDPWYVRGEALADIRRMIAMALNRARGFDRSHLQAIGERMLRAVRDNVKVQKNPNGSRFRKLTSNYAARKQKAHGFTVPILRASGDMLDGLHVRITRS